MTTLTNIFNWIKTHLVLVLSVVVGILCFVLNIERKKVSGLQTQASLEATKDKADVLSSQQSENTQKISDNNVAIDSAAQDVVKLEQQRKEQEQQESSKTPGAVEDYWKKQ